MIMTSEITDARYAVQGIPVITYCLVAHERLVVAFCIRDGLFGVPAIAQRVDHVRHLRSRTGSQYFAIAKLAVN